ncbi:6-phosphogluconolactonase [Echinicola strongylocentroti]|uniref:6-phosphogluconolactonase n=1 Tax=Echinicola strongylocentroti TaxID=1795355 RepID=A0A2Z4IP08_9BACT|nr:6-phosphogluconolactonase [Echinicola strongylocentroti]AWW32358.1 6-phosphogluconolactonase [Echinicola strongylocentroti]
MIQIEKDPAKLGEVAAALFVDAAKAAIQEKGKFNVALTGGSSPVKLYGLLAEEQFKSQVDWDKVNVFWGDERWVPLDNEQSNAGMAYETLLKNVPVPEKNIFPMWATGITPEARAQEYTGYLKKELGESGVFDLILLGMGDDGHCASLFPGTAVLNEQEKWVEGYFLKSKDIHRITLTAPLINRAKKIVFFVFGENKANALYEVLEGERNPSLYPSQMIAPVNGEVQWLVDEAAANRLNNN